jgi:hypothetical protein
MARGRLSVRAIAREPRVRLAGLLLTAGLAAVACGELVQDTAAGRSMHPLGTGIVTAAAVVIAAGLMTALVIAGQPFTALAAGACLGTCVSAVVEAAARVPWGRWLADPPGPAGPDTRAAPAP